MFPLYYFVLLLLGGVKLVFARRLASLERKFERVAKEVNTLLHQGHFKDGNSNKQDPYQLAKRQYLLGVLVQKKDRLEAKHLAWAHRMDTVKDRLAKLTHWKGRLVPYVLGVVDVLAVVCLVDYLRQGELVHLRQLVGFLTSQFQA